MTQKKAEQMLDAIMSNKTISKHVVSDTWLSGSSTEVSPITFWKSHVSLQMDTHKNLFKKAISKVLEDNPKLFGYGFFIANDGSCPSEIRFYYYKECEVF